MALLDPQSVQIGAVPSTLPRVSTGPTSSVYQKADDSVRMTVSHQNGKRKRSAVRLQYSKTAADPLISNQNIVRDMSVTVVIDRPLQGFDIVSEQKLVVDAMLAYLSANSDAVLLKVLGGES